MQLKFRVLLTGWLLMALGTAHADRLKVVATFSVLSDMVEQIAGDRVDLTILVGANGDTHLYEPTPGDLVAVSRADLVVLNGLAFEGWLPRLLETGGFKGRRLEVGEYIEPLAFAEGAHHEDAEPEDATEYEEDHHGDYDPHAWHSIPHGIAYLYAIRDALVDLDPANAVFYSHHTTEYVTRLEQLHQWALSAMNEWPEPRRRIITPHDAFGYLAHTYGLHIEAPQGLSTESEASARHMGKLIRQVRQNNIAAVFLENIASDGLVRQIQQDTGVGIGGTLYSDALSEPTGPAGTYEQMMRHNLRTILQALEAGQ